MVLTRSQYENMSKELIQELINITLESLNPSLVNNINAKLTDLSHRFNEFMSKYDKNYSELQQKRSYRIIVKFKSHKQKHSLVYKCKNLGTKSQELTNLKFLGRLFVSKSMSHENQQLAYKC